MCTVNIALHPFPLNKRVINPGIDRRSMMNIDDGSARGFYRIQVVVPVVKSRSPLEIRVDRMKGRYQQIEIIIKGVPLSHLPGSTVIAGQHGPAFYSDIDAALIPVRPGRWQYERF